MTPLQDSTGDSPNQSRHLRYLDGWRGVAIASVLAGHFFYVPLINMGRFGVELFFVLSGRLMAEILFVKKLSLPDFFRRRIARVWPALLVFLLAIGILSRIRSYLHVTGFNLWAALIVIANYTGAFGYRCAVLDHIWTLCIEEHTYLLLGLIAVWTRRTGANPATICLTGAGFCVLSGAFQTIVLHKDYYAVYWRTDARASSILLSCGLFLAFQKKQGFHLSFVPVVMGFIGFLLNLDPVPDVLKYSLGSTCLAFAVCLIDKAPAGILNILSQTILIRLGLWSFSLYLWQQPFAMFYGISHPYFALPALIICTLASFYLVEQPARRHLNTHWGKNRGKTTRNVSAGAFNSKIEVASE